MAGKVDVVVFGATGFTGRLITEYLAAHPQRNLFTLGVAARSAERLKKAILDLGLSNQDIKLITVDVMNPQSVEAAVKQARVVINTVGPFWSWGTPVVGACVRNHVHYVDLTGESYWIKKIITQFDWQASKKHTVIVPACGYDSIPSDVAAHLANKTLREHLSTNYPGVQGVGLHTSISAHKLRAGVSGGTLASVFTAITDVPQMLRKEAGNPFFLSPMKGRGLPYPKFVYNLPIPGQRSIVGSLWVMRGSNCAVVHRTAGLLQLRARNAVAEQRPDQDLLEKQTYGPSFVYDEFLAAKSKFSALISSVSLIVSFMLLLFKPTRLIAKYFLPKSGEGPPLHQKEKGFLRLTNITTSTQTNTVPELKIKTHVNIKGEPGYYKTAVMISESALCLLLPPVSLPSAAKAGYNPIEHLPPMAKEGGVLTPMTAFGDILIQRLKDTGSFEFSSQIVEAGAGDKKNV